MDGGAVKVVGAKRVAAMAAALALWSPAAAQADFTVNQTGDEADANIADAACDVSASAGSQCTLRAAIQEANDTVGTVQISFALPGSGVQTISPQSELPEIINTVVIDGYTQPGASPNTQPFGKPLDTVLRVEIDGSGLPFDFNSDTFEFDAGSAGSVLRGLVLSGNPNNAIRSDISADFAVEGNFIGTNPAGTAADTNGAGFFGFSGTARIGGPDPADTNVLSGNLEGAVGTNSPVSVERNYIGVGADGKTPIPNGNPLNQFSYAVGLYGTGNRIVRNIIANNSVLALRTVNAGTITYISQNRIFNNEGIGIDLQGDGVTANDPLDADTAGPNEFQNFPVVRKAKGRPSTVKISGVLNSEASGNYQVEFFESKQKRRESTRFLGSFPVTTDGDGVGKFKVEIGKRVKRGRYITATATDLSLGTEGGTSEFSKPRKVK